VESFEGISELTEGFVSFCFLGFRLSFRRFGGVDMELSKSERLDRDESESEDNASVRSRAGRSWM
jgi:hypothetical protein